jgi:hypothetical protein
MLIEWMSLPLDGSNPLKALVNQVLDMLLDPSRPITLSHIHSCGIAFAMLPGPCAVALIDYIGSYLVKNPSLLPIPQTIAPDWMKTSSISSIFGHTVNSPLQNPSNILLAVFHSFLHYAPLDRYALIENLINTVSREKDITMSQYYFICRAMGPFLNLLSTFHKCAFLEKNLVLLVQALKKVIDADVPNHTSVLHYQEHTVMMDDIFDFIGYCRHAYRISPTTQQKLIQACLEIPNIQIRNKLRQLL